MSLGIIAASSSSASYKALVLADGADAYWRMDDLAGSASWADHSEGAAHPFPADGTCLFQQPGLLSGDPNPAAKSDGTHGFGTLGFGAWMIPAAFTVECLFRIDTLGPGDQSLICQHQGGAAIFRWQVGSDGSYYVQVYGGGWTTLSGGGAGTIKAGKVYHGALTYAGGVWTLYLNGTLVGSLGKGLTNYNSPAMSLGWQNGGGYLNGTLDEAAHYPSALSDAQVLTHYKAAFGLGA